MTSPVSGSRRASATSLPGANPPSPHQADEGLCLDENHLPHLEAGPLARLSTSDDSLADDRPIELDSPSEQTDESPADDARALFLREKADLIQSTEERAREIGKTFDSWSVDPLAETLDLLQSLGRFAEAVPIAQSMSDRFKVNVLAEIYMRGGRPDLAVQLLEGERAKVRDDPSESKRVLEKTAFALAQARLLCGDPEGARRELPDELSARNFALKAMIEHSSGNTVASDAAFNQIPDVKPMDRITVQLWRDRLDDAMSLVRTHFSDRLAHPNLNDVNGWLRDNLVFSPFVIHAPCASVLAADESWQVLRECCGIFKELESVEVRTRPANPTTFTVTSAQVLTALRVMGRGDAAEALARKGTSQVIGGPLLFEFIQAHNGVWKDQRIKSGIMLGSMGRTLLADYFARKYNASICMHGRADPGDRLAMIVEAERCKNADVVRSAHYFEVDHEGFNHGVAVIYAREPGDEPGDPPKESLFFFDSVPDKETFAKARKSAAELPGSKIQVYELDRDRDAKLQWGRFTCWTHAMKASVVLTQHTRDAQGRLGDGFPITSLIDELERNVIDEDEDESVKFVRPMPELARLAQHRNAVSEEDLDEVLLNSKRGKTLGQAITESTVVVNGSQGETKVLDYARQKGIQYAILAQGLAYSKEIGKVCKDLGLDWTLGDEDAFVAEIKKAHKKPIESRSNPTPLVTAGKDEDEDEGDEDIGQALIF